MYRYQSDPESGRDWLLRLARRWPGAARLNPEPPEARGHGTASVIGRIFPKFRLTLYGLDGAIRALVGPRAPHRPRRRSSAAERRVDPLDAVVGCALRIDRTNVRAHDRRR